MIFRIQMYSVTSRSVSSFTRCPNPVHYNLHVHRRVYLNVSFEAIYVRTTRGTTQYHIPEVRSLNYHRCEDLIRDACNLYGETTIHITYGTKQCQNPEHNKLNFHPSQDLKFHFNLTFTRFKYQNSTLHYELLLWFD